MVAADTDQPYLVAEGTAVSHVLVTPFQTNAFGEPLLEPNALANFSAIFQGTRYRLTLQTQPARPDLVRVPPLPFPQKVGTHHVMDIFCDGLDN